MTIIGWRLAFRWLVLVSMLVVLMLRRLIELGELGRIANSIMSRWLASMSY